jgi:hypothetical protein
LQAATEVEAEYVNLAKETSCDQPTSLDGSHGKYEIHLNVSTLSGCFFNFGPGANSWTFPLAKKD